MIEKNVFQRGESDEEKVGRFVAGSSLTLVGSVVSGILLFVWNVVMQRLLGPEGFGLARPFLDVFLILSVVVALGVPETMQTFISHHHQDDPEESAREMGEGARLLFLAMAAVSVPAVAGALVFKAQFSPLMWGFTWLMIAGLWGRMLYFPMFAAMGGVQRLDLVALCNITFPAMVLGGSTAMILLVRRTGGGEYASILAAVGGVSAGTLTQFLISLLVGPKAGISLKRMYGWRSVGAGAGKLLAFGRVAWVSLTARTFFSFIPAAAVSFMAHKMGYFGRTYEANAVQAGYFSSAFTYALAPMLIVGMLFALLPAISEAHAKNNRVLMQRYYDLAVKYAFTVMLFVLAEYSVLAGPIVEFFSGEKYPAGVVGGTAFVLAVGVCGCMFMTLLINLLLGVKNPGAPAVAASVLLVIETAAIVAASKIYGTVFAAAAAFTVSVLLAVVLLVAYVAGREGMKWKWIMPARPLAAAVVTAAVLKLMPVSSPEFFLSLLAGAPIYFVVLGMLGGIDGDDFEMVRGMLGALRLGPVSGFLNIVEKLFSLSPLYMKKENQ